MEGKSAYFFFTCGVATHRSHLSQVHSHWSGLHPDHSQCPELREKLDIIGLNFQVSRYFNPAFNHTEEVPSYFQTAMGHSQVKRVG